MWRLTRLLKPRHQPLPAVNPLEPPGVSMWKKKTHSKFLPVHWLLLLCVSGSGWVESSLLPLHRSLIRSPSCSRNRKYCCFWQKPQRFESSHVPLLPLRRSSAFGTRYTTCYGWALTCTCGHDCCCTLSINVHSLVTSPTNRTTHHAESLTSHYTQ